MGTEKLLFRIEQPHGSGDIYLSWQKGSGIYLATTGIDSIVNILDRYGEIVERIRLPNLCTSFGWDVDGDLLGIVSQSQLIIWDANIKKKSTIDVGLKDLMSCLIWAKTGPFLAVGTNKGNVSIYNHNTSRRIPVIGKHTKKIICGCWNSDNLLALGSEDKSISVSNLDGDTIKVINLRADPSELQFSGMKMDEKSSKQNTISAVVGKKTLYLYNLNDPDNPFELAFQQHYGNIVKYQWYGDGYILIGFSTGFFISISTHIKEVGQELFQIRNHKTLLTDITVNKKIGKAATCGDSSVKIHDLSNLQETSSVINLPQESGLDRISWSTDGQLLAVCTKNGSVNIYVSHMQLLTSVCVPRIAILSSLTEVSLYNYSSDKSKLTPNFVHLESEPSFIGVGQYHLAAGSNNRIWFYDLNKNEPGSDLPLKLSDRQYLGAVSSIKLNPEYVSVLFEGRIQLHMIEQPQVCHEDRETIIFPNPANDNQTITSHELTTEFLIYATDMGQLVHFHIEEWAVANLYKHNVGICQFFVDPAGSRVIFFDDKTNAFVYNAVTSDVVPIPKLPTKVVGAIWDNNISDRNIFIIFDDQEIHTYIYVRFSVEGSSVKKIGTTSLVSKQVPLLLYKSEVMCATADCQISQLTLATHDTVYVNVPEQDKTVLNINFNKQVALHRFAAALSTCKALKSNILMANLAEECLKWLDIETALTICRELEDVSMVLSLEDVLDIEDWKLLSGHLSMFLQQYDLAQKWFLASNNPIVALEMRRDLLQWEEALQLAKKMAPEQISMISREYAQQLEFLGNYQDALIHYEKGLQENLSEEHTFICKAGIARSTLHCGNYRHGISIAVELDNKQLLKDSAEILDKKRQTAEAAMLFEKCDMFDKAASNYILLKNWAKVGSLLPNITNTKIHYKYANAKEKEGRYEEAVKAYEKAKDFDAVIRLHLEKLNNPEVAVELVQETKSIEGAKLVAKFFQNINDTKSAIRFLVLSRCIEDAFELAKKNGNLEIYGEILLNSFTEDEIRPKDFANLAQHFENSKTFLLAGKYWFHAREYHKAMKHLLNAAKSNSNEKEAISTAIDAVASSNDESLATVLIEYLLGDSDGVPKDPKYLFRLYMARKQYREASKSALIIANEEQINGNYRNAHDVLFSMYQELKQNDVVPILTSTVIECHRAGLKHSAFKYATMLMNPEYRKEIDPKYSKKIEAVVRKPPRNGKESGDASSIGDPAEPSTSCPYCDKSLLETEMVCTNCKNNLPFCIATGRHISLEDLTCCPNCDFPALRQEFVEILNSDDSCPMCSERVDVRRLTRLQDYKPYLNIE